MLVVDGVSKHYGGLVALEDVSFEVKKGEIVGLIGPNGAGKTTLFEVISGFLRPNSGRVLFNGHRIDGLKPHQVLSRGLARSFQQVQAFPSFTVYQNLLASALYSLPMKEARKRTDEILALIGLSSKAESLISSLCFPDQRLIEFAKVMALQPQMILLDEAMAGLTDTETHCIMALIRSLWEQGVTFLLVEHRTEVVMDLCQRIVVMNFGMKLADGTPDEIMRNKDVIESYLGEEVYIA